MASSSSGLSTSQHRWERRTDILNQLGSADLDPWDRLPGRQNSADLSDDDGFDDADADAPNLYDSDDEGNENPDKLTPTQCSGEFLELLMDTFSDGACLTAKTVCLLCFWASKAGMAGAEVQRLGRPDGLDTGKYQAHLDSVLELRDDVSKMLLKIPDHSKKLSVDTCVTSP